MARSQARARVSPCNFKCRRRIAARRRGREGFRCPCRGSRLECGPVCGLAGKAKRDRKGRPEYEKSELRSRELLLYADPLELVDPRKVTRRIVAPEAAFDYSFGSQISNLDDDPSPSKPSMIRRAFRCCCRCCYYWAGGRRGASNRGGPNLEPATINLILTRASRSTHTQATYRPDSDGPNPSFPPIDCLVGPAFKFLPSL